MAKHSSWWRGRRSSQLVEGRVVFGETHVFIGKKASTETIPRFLGVYDGDKQTFALGDLTRTDGY
jgi:hypothetical protein